MFTFASGIMGIAVALAFAHCDTRSLFDTFKEFISVLTTGLAGLFFIGVFVRIVKGRAAVAGLWPTTRFVSRSGTRPCRLRVRRLAGFRETDV